MIVRDSLRRAAIVAAVGTAVILGTGWVAEVWRFGPTTEASFAHVERAVVRTVDEMVASLERTASRVATDPDVSVGLSTPDARPLLFDVIRSAIDSPGNADVSVTVYDAVGSARAWAGRPSEIPSGRILDGESFFVAPGPLGLRLIYVRPLRAPGRPGESGQIGSMAVERVLSPAGGITESEPDSYRLTAPLADVSLRTVYEGAGSRQGPFTIEVRAPSGELLLEGDVREEDLVSARMAWRGAVRALTLVFLAFALAVGCGPLIVRPPRGLSPRDLAIRASGATAGCLLGYGLLRLAVGRGMSDATFGLFDPAIHVSIGFPILIRSPVDLFLFGVALVGLFLVGAFVVDQARLAPRQVGQVDSVLRSPVWIMAHIAGRDRGGGCPRRV